MRAVTPHSDLTPHTNHKNTKKSDHRGNICINPYHLRVKWVPEDIRVHFWNPKIFSTSVDDAFRGKKTVIFVKKLHKIVVFAPILLFLLLFKAADAWQAPQVEPGGSSWPCLQRAAPNSDCGLTLTTFSDDNCLKFTQNLHFWAPIVLFLLLFNKIKACQAPQAEPGSSS